MTVYYNEIEPFAAQWLRNLIAAGHIADGVVDDRSIEDVHPADVREFTQCHFFAGVGIWSHALRGASWADDRPVWTGSCPCQPFSAAGQGAGFADERHLWPAWHHLIRECRPAVVFGEQVASSDAMPWLDLVQDDLEALGYAFGAVPFPAASVGAPHIRDRLYFVADGAGVRREQGGLRTSGGVGSHCIGSQPQPGADSSACMLADHQGCGRGEECSHIGRRPKGDRSEGLAAGPIASGEPCNGHWRAHDWILCADPDGAAWRPVEPGTFPLAHGVTGRVGRLRAYGNGIVAPQARAFIEAVIGCAP